MTLPADIGACATFARERLPRLDADFLTCEALGVPRSNLFAFQERPVPSPQARRLASWVERRVAGEPVAYILRRRGFWNLELETSPAALIPRPDTETLVAAALPRIHARSRVLDVGTGCGNVALAIAAERPQARVLATDVDPRCVALCRRNAARLALRVEARVADCFDGLVGGFDVIVSNPPYVAAGDKHLAQGDLRFEPRLALVGGCQGLDFIARLVRAAPAQLRPGGWLCLEHGWDQHEAVATLFSAAGFKQVELVRDIAERPRVTLGAAPA